MESQPQNQHGVAPPDSKFENEVMPFTKFFFSDLENVTHSFSVNKIVAVEGSNVVYKGNLQNIGSIAIKKFKTKAFPDPDKFEEEAKRVGELKHKRFVSLIGCCSDGDERLLVAEFLPNDTLAMRLFHDNNNTLEWSMRLKVACGIAEALDYCSTKGFTSFSNLSANSILFDDGDNACLSCFGLMKESEDGQTTSVDQFTSVASKFGCVLLNLLTGKQYPDHAAMIHGQGDVTEFLDPKLEGNFPTEEAILLLGLAAQCMEQDIKRIPTFELLQMEKQYKEAAPSGQDNPLSPLQTTQCLSLGPPRKPANKAAGSRRSGPRRRHKTTATQNDEEREAENKAAYEKWKIRQAEKNARKEEKPKAKKTKPVQARNSNHTPKANNSKTSSRF